MALIRQSNAHAAISSAVRLDLGDLTRQGEAIVAAARAQAERILADARAQRERLIADAHEIGLQRGTEQGIAQGQAQGLAKGREEALASTRERLDALEARWAVALDAFHAARERMLLEAKQDVLRLALDIARIVCKRELAAHPERVVDQLAAVLAIIARSTRLVISVHPDDAPLVRDALPQLALRHAGAEHIELNDDPSLERCSVIATMASGARIDATIRTQLDRIVEALLPAPADPTSTERAP